MVRIRPLSIGCLRVAELAGCPFEWTPTLHFSDAPGWIHQRSLRDSAGLRRSHEGAAKHALRECPFPAQIQ
jgi:hypothetical protein